MAEPKPQYCPGCGADVEYATPARGGLVIQIRWKCYAISVLREDGAWAYLPSVACLESRLKVAEQARERAEAENKRLARGLAAAAEIARLDPCEYDHHGLCQTHNMQPKGECWAEVVLACEAAKESGQ